MSFLFDDYTAQKTADVSYWVLAQIDCLQVGKLVAVLSEHCQSSAIDLFGLKI